MEVTSLRNIALEAVVDYIHEGIYNKTNYFSGSEISNEIYEQLVEKYYPKGCPRNLLEQFRSKLNLTRIDLQNQKFSDDIVRMLERQKLESMKVEESETRIRKCQPYGFDKKLNQTSRENLKHLEIKSHKFGCTSSIHRNFPNLESLIITDARPLSAHIFEFFYYNFSSLKVLHFNALYTTTLRGISNLKNLEVLCMQNLTVRSHYDLMELFECKKLTMLDISFTLKYPYRPNLVGKFLECQKVLPELRFLDCQTTDIDEDKLAALISGHKNLKQVVVIDTIIENYSSPDVELLNNATPVSFLKCFKHYLTIRRAPDVYYLLSRISFEYLIGWNPNVYDKQIFVQFLRLVCEAMEVFQSDEKIYVEGMKCLKWIAIPQNLSFFSPQHLLLLVNQLIDSVTKFLDVTELWSTHEHIWDILFQDAILELPILNVRKFITFAMNYSKRNPHIGRESLVLRSYLIPKLNIEELTELYPRSELLEPVMSWLYYKKWVNGDTLEQFREKVGKALEIIRRITSRNCGKACERLLEVKGLTRIGLVIIYHASMFSANWLPGKRQFIEIFKNLIRVEACGEKIRDQMAKMLKSIDENTYSLALLPVEFRSLILCSVTPNQNRKNLEIWRQMDQEILKMCSKVLEFEESYLDFYLLNNTILKDTIQKSKFDGPIIWALLTIMVILGGNKTNKSKLRESGLYSMVQSLRSDNKEVARVRQSVLRFRVSK